MAEHGPNELIERGLRSPCRILAAQFTEVMVVVLIVAAAISFLVGDLKDTIVILVIVVLNAVLGFTQEYRAERAMAALKKMVVPRVKVRRDGQVRDISARELVPGDLFLLETGGAVPADGRLLESINLRLQEAALTGESVPVDKSTGALTGEHLALGDRRNMAFLGTVITYGRGLGVVTATGMETELGHIATMIQAVESEPTPLQRRMTQLGKSGPLLNPDDAPLAVPDTTLSLLLTSVALCNDATLEPDQERAGGYQAIGDPTEGALVVAAARIEGSFYPIFSALILHHSSFSVRTCTTIQALIVACEEDLLTTCCRDHKGQLTSAERVLSSMPITLPVSRSR